MLRKLIDESVAAEWLGIFAPDVEFPLLTGEEVEYLYTGQVLQRDTDGKYYLYYSQKGY